MSRLRRLVLSDRFFFVTCNLRRTRRQLSNGDFDCLAEVIAARRRDLRSRSQNQEIRSKKATSQKETILFWLRRGLSCHLGTQ